MPVDERARELAFEALVPVVGEEVASVLSRELPGVELATKEQVDRRFEQVDRRFEQVDHRFELLAAELQALRGELLAAFRGELVAAVSGQTRMMLLGIFGAVVTMALAALAFAQLL